MGKIFVLIKKNFRLLLNAKFNSLVFIFAPLILIFVLCFALSNTSITNVTCSIYISEDINQGDSFISSLVEKLNDHSFSVNTKDSLYDCKKDVIDGISQVCIEVLKDEFDSGGGFDADYSYILNLYVDFSQQRTVWNIIGTIQWIAEQESDEIRHETIVDLKEELSDADVSINQIKTNLDSSEEYISKIKANINFLENQQTGIDSKINELSLNINSIKNNLDLINSAGILVPPYGDYLASSQQILDEMSSDVTSIGTYNSGMKNSLETLKDYVSVLEDNLDNIRDSFDDLENTIGNLEESDLDKIVNPISVKYTSVVDEKESGEVKNDLQDLDYLFPNFIMFFILFSSIIYGSVNVIKERQSNSYIRNISSKVKGFGFVFSSFFTSLIIVLIQICVMLFVSNYFLNISLFSNVYSLALFLILSISSFVILGVLIGFIFNSQESSIIGAIFFSLLFFMFSSLISPLQTLPKTISNIVSLTPYSILEAESRSIFIFESQIGLSITQIIALVAFFILCFILIAVFYRKSKEKEI